MRPFEQVEVLRAACCIAGADGEVSQQESAILQQLADQAGVGDASLQAMVDRATSDRNFCDEQFRILKTDARETTTILLQTAVSDGKIGETEAESLKLFAKRLGVTQEIFDELIAQHVK